MGHFTGKRQLCCIGTESHQLGFFVGKIDLQDRKAVLGYTLWKLKPYPSSSTPLLSYFTNLLNSDAFKARLRHLIST